MGEGGVCSSAGRGGGEEEERRGAGMSRSGYWDDVRSWKRKFGVLLRKCCARLRDCCGGDVRSIGRAEW